MRADILDRARNFSIVTPHFKGAAYFQDGRYFGIDGSRVLLPGEVPKAEVVRASIVPPVPQPAIRESAGPVPAPAPLLVAPNNQPAVLTLCPNCGRPFIPAPSSSETELPVASAPPAPRPTATQPRFVPPAETPPADEKVNLTAWGKGLEVHQWVKIRAAFREELGIAQIKNKQDALERLLERDIITQEDYEREAKLKIES